MFHFLFIAVLLSMAHKMLICFIPYLLLFIAVLLSIACKMIICFISVQLVLILVFEHLEYTAEKYTKQTILSKDYKLFLSK